MSDPKRVVKLAKQFREVLEVAEDLAKIGDLEQATRNAEQAIAVAQRDNKQVAASLALNKIALRGIEDELKVAEKLAEETVALAKQVAQDIVADAKAEAKDIIGDALRSERMVAARVVVDQKQHSDWVKDAKNQRDALQLQVDSIEKELEELRARIGGR